MNDPQPNSDLAPPTPLPVNDDVRPVLPVPLAAPTAAVENAMLLPVPDVDDGEAVAVAVADHEGHVILTGGPADLPPPDSNSLQKEKAAAVIAAIIVHALLAVLLGVLVVVVPGPPASEITAIAAPATTEQLPTSQKIAEPPPQQTTPQMTTSMKFVTAAGISAAPMPAVEFDPSATTLDLGTTLGNFNNNFAGAGTGSITMFGKQISTRSISVVMDVSGSMTPFIPIVAKELDKVAPGSNLVLYAGCGLLQEPENVDRELYTFEEAGDRFKNLPPDVFQQMMTRKKTFIIKARNINHAQTALLSRRAMMADTVYWFADFQDAIDLGVAKSLVETFKSKNKKIYMHAVRRGRSFDIVVEHVIKPLGGEVIETKVN